MDLGQRFGYLCLHKLPDLARGRARKLGTLLYWVGTHSFALASPSAGLASLVTGALHSSHSRVSAPESAPRTCRPARMPMAGAGLVACSRQMPQALHPVAHLRLDRRARPCPGWLRPGRTCTAVQPPPSPLVDAPQTLPSPQGLAHSCKSVIYSAIEVNGGDRPGSGPRAPRAARGRSSSLSGSLSESLTRRCPARAPALNSGGRGAVSGELAPPCMPPRAHAPPPARAPHGLPRPPGRPARGRARGPGARRLQGGLRWWEAGTGCQRRLTPGWRRAPGAGGTGVEEAAGVWGGGGVGRAAGNGGRGARVVGGAAVDRAGDQHKHVSFHHRAVRRRTALIDR